MMRILLFWTVIIFTSTLSLSAQKQVDTQSNSWYMYFGNHRISEKWGLHTEYQWRRADFGQTWQQSLMRVGIDYYIPDGPMITAGYGWIVSFPYGQQPISYSFNEHRIWEQLILKHKTGRFNFNHRYRLEQRFLERKKLDADGNFVQDEYIFRQRARYRLMVAIPLNNASMKEKTLFIAGYVEPFIGFGSGIGSNILDQNRLYGALGFQITHSLQVQAGYLNQMIFKSDAIHVERNHNFQLSLSYNIDLRQND